MALHPQRGQPEKYGDWTFIRILGSGGFGQVSLWESSQGVRLAVKQCKNHLNSKNEKRWRQEVEMMQNLNHPSIVNFQQVPKEIEDNYVKFYVPLGMEFCEAGDLRRFLSQAENCCGLREFHVRSVLHNIGSAVDYLHDKQIVHRDLKPENIVMKKQAENLYQFKIIDLGYAKELNENSFGTSFVGTMHYLAPEFYGSNPLHYTATVDFWSLGLLVFECITGRRPFYPHHELLQILNELREKKRNEHICTVDEGPRIKYSSSLPQPHSLNPVFARRIEVWLQLMLKLDPKIRGGEEKKGWFKHLESILHEQCIQVFNTQNNSLLTIPAPDDRMSITKLQEAIFHKSRIPSSAQILLLQDGKKPDLRTSAIKQCWRAPEPQEWLVFMFNNQGDYQRYTCELPAEIQAIISGPRGGVSNWLATLQNPIQRPQKIRGILKVATNCIREEARVCHRSVAALSALSHSIELHTSHYEQRRKYLREVFNVFRGKHEFFQFSLEKDFNLYIENRQIELGDLFQSWMEQKNIVMRYREQTLPTMAKMLEGLPEPGVCRGYVKVAQETCMIASKKISEWENEAWVKYQAIKTDIRKVDATRPLNDAEPNALHQGIMDLVENFVPKTLGEINKNLIRTSDQIRVLVDWHKWMNENLPKIEGALLNLEIQGGELFELQRKRQFDLGGLVSGLQNELQSDYVTTQQHLHEAEDQVNTISDAGLETEQEIGQNISRITQMMEVVASDKTTKSLDDLNRLLCDIEDTPPVHPPILNPPPPILNPSTPILNPSTPILNPPTPILNPPTPILNPPPPILNPPPPSLNRDTTPTPHPSSPHNHISPHNNSPNSTTVPTPTSTHTSTSKPILNSTPTLNPSPTLNETLPAEYPNPPPAPPHQGDPTGNDLATRFANLNNNNNEDLPTSSVEVS